MRRGNPHCSARGRQARERIIRVLFRDLSLGSVVPKNIEGACLLGVDPTMAGRHIRRALSECGYVTQRFGQRRVIVEAPLSGIILLQASTGNSVHA